ncbi:MAG: hypothetical protein LBM25_02880 [Bacteroidales bacterium]|jgi:hypothetical protein|nr:hypothetical protein [Bacteroidales bacterium]
MKKIISFFALITIVINAFGQIPDMETFVKKLTDSGSVYTQKVQQWNNDTLIVLSQATNLSRCSFYLIDEVHNTVLQAMVEPSDTVKDFKVFNNTIWFCGSYSSMPGTYPLGFVANASLQDLFANQTYHLRYTKPMFSVDKIEICIDPNTHHTIICGIGISGNVYPQAACFLHYDCIYDSALVFTAPNTDEIYDDIVIKQDYSINNAFVVGRSSLFPTIAILGIRNFNISNPYNNTGSYTNLSNITQGYFQYPLVADSLISKFIAVAGIITNFNNFEEIDVFQIDVSSIQTPIITEGLFSEPYPIGAISIKDLMLYLGPNTHNYKLLALGNGPIFPNPNIFNFIVDIDFINDSFDNIVNAYFSDQKILFNSFTKTNRQIIISTGVSFGNNVINTFKTNPFRIRPNNCYNVSTFGIHKMNIGINPSSLMPITNIEAAHYHWEYKHANVISQNINLICH